MTQFSIRLLGHAGSSRLLLLQVEFAVLGAQRMRKNGRKNASGLSVMDAPRAELRHPRRNIHQRLRRRLLHCRQPFLTHQIVQTRGLSVEEKPSTATHAVKGTMCASIVIRGTHNVYRSDLRVACYQAYWSLYFDCRLHISWLIITFELHQSLNVRLDWLTASFATPSSRRWVWHLPLHSVSNLFHPFLITNYFSEYLQSSTGFDARW